MKKLFFLIIFILFHQFICSQTTQTPNKIHQKAFAKLDYLSIKMPISNILNEANMGFTGIHYNLMINDWAYTGLGIYGAITGERGGFFTLGINAGIKKNLFNQFYLDTGFHFGGGGGAGAPDGGGAFILPHFNLGYNFKNFTLNSGWSYANFFDGGQMKGHQLNVSLEFPLDFEYADAKYAEKDFNLKNLENSAWNQLTSKNSLMVHFNNLKVLSKANATTNEVLKGKTIKLAGFEFTSYFTNNWLAFIKVDGAYDGIRAGYMDVFLGAGYLLSLNKNNTNILAKVGIGAAGGGGVNTNGGLALYPDISIEQKIFKDIYLSVNKGYLLTPKKHFYTSTFGLGLKYYLERNGIKTKHNAFTLGKFKGVEVIMKQDLYLNANRDLKPTKNLHQISLQINVDLNKTIYISGQTSFANFGDAGAYAEGLIGAGLKTLPFFNNTTTLFSQFLAGAAGGGDVSTGQGLIIKPSLGFDYKLNNTLSLRASGGYVKAIEGLLSSPMINLGLKYNISILKLK